MKTTGDQVKTVKEATTEGELVDALVAEAKSSWLPDEGRDASLAEEKLFARIAKDDAAARVRVVRGGGAGLWAPFAAMGAVAAGVAFFMHPRGEALAPTAEVSAPSEAAPSRGAVAPAATLTSVTGAGVVRVDQVPVETAELREGQKVESVGGDATFIAPGRVDWVLESGTVVAVARSGSRGGAIVLGLESGAVEAQVTPVAMGEAFAVDVDGVRVAVHGTHLRVARDGSHVVVDLTEGVISVGTPPKTGTTYGTLVTAPAHVEFSTADVTGSLRIDHDGAHVRAPLALNEQPPAVVAAAPVVAAPVVVDDPRPPVVIPSVAAMPRPPAGVASAPPPRPLSPTEQVIAAVRTCAQDTVRSGSVAVTVNSMLTVDVSPDGSARLATFDPPLAPELQSCVGRAVYATHWTEAGAHRIPIELHR